MVGQSPQHGLNLVTVLASLSLHPPEHYSQLEKPHHKHPQSLVLQLEMAELVI